MTLKTRFFLLICSALPAAIFFAPTSATIPVSANRADGRDADRAAIRAHIESIFQAFIDSDIDKIFATHSEDWRGFLENSRAPIRGIDEYMRANGIQWPKSANAPKPSANPNPSANAGPRGYRVKDFDVIFYSPELAVACFIGEFIRTTGNTTEVSVRYRILDVYAKRNGNWIQVSSHTVVDPAWRQEQMTTPTSLPPQARQQILNAREAVWKAYFSNDRATLEKLIPEEVIAINEGSEAWADRAAILAGAQRFVDSGAKLVRLEFPKTEMQIYGNIIILYTTFLYEIEAEGKRTTTTGRGTEMFVRRGGNFVNVGWHLDDGK